MKPPSSLACVQGQIVLTLDRCVGLLTIKAPQVLPLSPPLSVCPVLTIKAPQFRKVKSAIIRYVSTNTKYPPIAKDAGIQGTVFVYFVVGKDGVVRDVRVLRPVDSRLDAEATRVVKSLPKFVPGRQQGKSVSVQYTIPVKFIIR